MIRNSLAVLLVLSLVASAHAADWPQWRGPTLDGHSAEKNLPTKWSASENIAWKAAIPGTGHSSPIVVGDRVFLTTCIEDKQQRVLLCLDRKTGKELWQQVAITAPLEKKHPFNNYASATPACDGQRVYVAFLEVSRLWLICYDLDGKELWRKSPGQFHSMHGWAAAPILYKDLIILNGDQDADAYLVAYERESGKERWRAARPGVRSYCVPLIVSAAGKDQMVLSGAATIAGYDPATGKQFWSIDTKDDRALQYVASPVFAEDTFFVTAGFPTFHIIGIDPAGSGDVTKTHQRYHHKIGAYVPSPIAVGNLVYMTSDQDKPKSEGQLWVYEAKTGKRLYSQQLGKRHWPSPVYADGHLYFLSEQGETWVIKPGEKFDLVSRNALDEPCFASPAISQGQIFIRTFSNLYCIK